jgi:O-6-methylguanine DNA methyltransferase
MPKSLRRLESPMRCVQRARPVSVLIPCHRVIRSDGGLGGYAYGLERKRRLLAWESGQGGLFLV